MSLNLKLLLDRLAFLTQEEFSVLYDSLSADEQDWFDNVMCDESESYHEG